MRTIVLLLLLLLLVPVAGRADVGEVVSKLQATYQAAIDWRAQFTQSTYVELLRRKIEKKGEIVVKKPGKLRIAYAGPEGRVYLSDGKKLWVYVPGDYQVQEFKKASKVVSREALSFLEGLGDLSRDFVVTAWPSSKKSEAMMVDDGLVLIDMKPRRPDSVFTHIVAGVDPKTNWIREATLYNQSGNKTHYVFREIRFNTNPADGEFFYSQDR